MTFQEKMIEATADLRARASAVANAAFRSAKARASATAEGVDGLKGSLAVLKIAGRELKKVARRHATTLVKDNVIIATAAGKDLSALARSTYKTLRRPVVAQKSRKPRATRKRSAKRAAA